mmetsp:Transcript_44360/g.72213  ORF Transcript_44360/g.72213 Transcript_44360/m.72213 type:complete len:222 (+) Transcript_44360:1010-1675(+)
MCCVRSLSRRRSSLMLPGLIGSAASKQSPRLEKDLFALFARLDRERVYSVLIVIVQLAATHCAVALKVGSLMTPLEHIKYSAQSMFVPTQRYSFMTPPPPPPSPLSQPTSLYLKAMKPRPAKRPRRRPLSACLLISTARQSENRNHAVGRNRLRFSTCRPRRLMRKMCRAARRLKSAVTARNEEGKRLRRRRRFVITSQQQRTNHQGAIVTGTAKLLPLLS